MIKHPDLLKTIDSFLSETGMGESYFGKKATGNSEVVSRLRSGGRVWPETEMKLRSFMIASSDKIRRAKKYKSSPEDDQGAPA